MLAVLPFKNMGAPGDQYFADGLTEEITSRLAGVSDLGVVSRTSTDPYKGTNKNIRQIGQELGVGYILEGSVRWEKSPGGGSRVRVTPQLIRVADDRHLWADRYDAELADVFQVQSSIAEQVTSAMNLALDPSEKQTNNERPTENTEAYVLYLRGIEYGTRGPDREDFHNSVEMFRRAVALDSNFAQAWARLSEGRSREYWFFFDRSEAALSEAKAAAERALRLRPDLAESHIALGYYYYWGKLDYDRALQELALARERQPNNADLYMATAAVQRRQGRWTDAVANFEKAVELSPRSTDAIGNLTETYTLVRKYDEACRAADKAISFTEAGQSHAEGIVRRHRLIERFLTDVLGIPWDEVHEEAERLEHAMSPVLEERMLAAIGDAKTCPHGHPITPGTRIEGVPLADVAQGAKVTILRFENEAEDLLHELRAAGLEPGLQGVLAEPAGEEVVVEAEGKRVTVTHSVAETVSVLADPSPPPRIALPEQLVLSKDRYGR